VLVLALPIGLFVLWLWFMGNAFGAFLLFIAMFLGLGPISWQAVVFMVAIAAAPMLLRAWWRNWVKAAADQPYEPPLGAPLPRAGD